MHLFLRFCNVLIAFNAAVRAANLMSVVNKLLWFDSTTVCWPPMGCTSAPNVTMFVESKDSCKRKPRALLCLKIVIYRSS